MNPTAIVNAAIKLRAVVDPLKDVPGPGTWTLKAREALCELLELVDVEEQQKPTDTSLRAALEAARARFHGLRAQGETGGAIYPCVECGVMRTKAEGGTVFTVCDECWDKTYRKSPCTCTAGDKAPGHHDRTCPVALATVLREPRPTFDDLVQRAGKPRSSMLATSKKGKRHGHK